MSKMINNYLEVLFKEVPRTKRALELQEEISANMNERFEDYINQGKTEMQAYSLTVANMGDIDDLLAEVTPDLDFQVEATRYRKRNAINTGIAVSLYILGPVFVIGSSLFPNEAVSILAVMILLILVAVATGIIIYTNMSTPREFRDYDEISKEERLRNASPTRRKFQAIMSIYWSVITGIYLLYSFVTMSWHISWVIWPIAGIVSGILKTIVEWREINE